MTTNIADDRTICIDGTQLQKRDTIRFLGVPLIKCISEIPSLIKSARLRASYGLFNAAKYIVSHKSRMSVKMTMIHALLSSILYGMAKSLMNFQK